MDGLRDIDLLKFTENKKKIAYSASFGINEIPNEFQSCVRNDISKFKALSVRENVGKRIIEDLTLRKDVEVMIDPTMLLDSSDWNKLLRKPAQLKENEKFILCYFLGKLSENRLKEIERIAHSKNCKIINLLDKNCEFYETGPSEFLYLEKYAELICTDSFHSSVFAILFNKPFVIFEREDNIKNMNSRIETLLQNFKIEDRKFKEKITELNMNCDYTEAHKILQDERIKSENFLKKALDIEE